jgi:HAD superfamily hydrolase (TIGR01490 family)
LALAIFDLDNTLLRGDSDVEWGRFLIHKGAVDAEYAAREHDRYYAEYVAGTLNIYEFLEFQLKPLAEHPRELLEAWRREFLDRHIKPLITDSARQLIEHHRSRGDTLLIITATNSFITGPIAECFGIEQLIATEPEQRDGHFTGKVAGTPCYREGKVVRLNHWLQANGRDLNGSWFYSDSHNDLPLLAEVDHPVAVNPDAQLEAHARSHHWQILDLQ